MNPDEPNLEKLHRIRTGLAERIADAVAADRKPLATTVEDYRDVCEQIARHSEELKAWIDEFMHSRAKVDRDD